jgi:archaeosine synthase
MTHSSPANASILRQVNNEHYDFIEEFTPTVGSKHVPLIGPESYNAPAVKRFRERIVQRYSPVDGKRIILLLPCSARKPYSDSKSHKRFRTAIESSVGRSSDLLSETILTSPLGLVPRELERAFPAASYDIPVTGVWDDEETEIAASALTSHLSKFADDAVVVAHVSGGYLEIVKRAEPGIKQGLIYTTPEDSPTNRDSIDALRDTLKDISEDLDMKGVPHGYLREIVRATADFQFGKGAGDLLLPAHARIRGKPYGTILCKIQGEQVCSFVGETGTLSLTLAGGRLLQPLGQYQVRFDAARAKGGSIFAVGISDADSNIRPGDEVLVLNPKDELVAVGRSEMSGREMCELNRGRAVSIRHKLEG